MEKVAKEAGGVCGLQGWPRRGSSALLHIAGARPKIDMHDNGAKKIERTLKRTCLTKGLWWRHVLGLLMLSFVGVSLADDAERLAKFAKINTGKYEGEIKNVGGIGMGSVVTLRAESDATDLLFGDYDPKSMLYENVGATNINSARFRKRCVATGSYVGRSLYGMNHVVKKMKCTEFYIKASLDGLNTSREYCRNIASKPYVDSPIINKEYCAGLSIKKTVFKMSPSEYRGSKDKGFKYEVEFVVGDGVQQEVVKGESTYVEPTIDSPIEWDTDFYYVEGVIKRVKVFAYDGKKLLAEYPEVTK